MNPKAAKQYLAQLDAILGEGKSLLSKSRYRDRSDVDSTESHKVIASARAAVERITGLHSPYARHVEQIMATSRWPQVKMQDILGVVASLRAAIEDGYLDSLTELIHGELFGDLLEMARHLLDEGYKDPAAVVAGAALEAHVRQLCLKHGIPVEIATSSGTRPKKADAMNSELAAATAYSKLDQKNVTAWLDLRNRAAHGKFDEYSREQVALMIAGVQDFITRNPA